MIQFWMDHLFEHVLHLKSKPLNSLAVLLCRAAPTLKGRKSSASWGWAPVVPSKDKGGARVGPEPKLVHDLIKGPVGYSDSIHFD